MKKFFKIIAALFLTFLFLLTSAMIIYLLINYISVQNVYNSYSDRKLAHKIERKLESSARQLRRTKKTKTINLKNLTKDKKINKICVVGPYNRDINKTINVNWQQSKIWKSEVVNDDGLFSIFLIYDKNVIPIKIKRKAIIDYNTYLESSCTNFSNNTNIELILNNSYVYLKLNP